MRLYVEVIKAIFRFLILRQSRGSVIRKFCEKNGVVYIKFAQILSTQRVGDIFREEDRLELAKICDECNPIPFSEIENTLKKEYQVPLSELFSEIEEIPLGSASVSQVHKATLQSGEEVVLKVKRNDLTKTLYKDIKQIKKLMQRFGRFVGFQNMVGGEHALNLYTRWIIEETNFVHERENMKHFHDFAASVNGNVAHTTKIVAPKLYEDICTENVIVMEYVPHPTINKIELTEENKEKIKTAFNSYIQLSFYALFNGKKVMFHGDPHSGNIYIDDEGNLGFLDFGLAFLLTDEDSVLTKKMFLAAYTRNKEELTRVILNSCPKKRLSKVAFDKDVAEFLREVKGKPITFYFAGMILVVMKHEMVPPTYLFGMAKTFICLEGIRMFSDNFMDAMELLHKQVVRFYISEGTTACTNLLHKGVTLIPKVALNIFKKGLTEGTTDACEEFASLCQELDNSLEKGKEVLAFFQSASKMKSGQ